MAWVATLENFARQCQRERAQHMVERADGQEYGHTGSDRTW